MRYNMPALYEEALFPRFQSEVQHPALIHSEGVAVSIPFFCQALA